jgi:uncharacterized protein YjdB
MKRVIYIFSLSLLALFLLAITAFAVDVINPISISLQESYTVYKNDSYTIRPDLNPANATTQLTWESADPSIAEIHLSGIGYSGNIVGISPGTTTITVTTSNGKSATCVVHVEDSIEPTSISVPANIELNVGESMYIPVTKIPDNSYCFFDISSDDETIVEVFTGGSHNSVGVRALKAGTVTISVYTNTGLTVTSIVNIIDAGSPTNISIPSSISVVEGGSYDFTPSFTPENLRDRFYIKADDDLIVRVATTGSNSGCRIYGVAAGTTTVTVYSESGLYSTSTVTVEHSWDEGQTIKESTLSTEGRKGYFCTICAAKEVVPIPMQSPSNKEGRFENYDIIWHYEEGGTFQFLGNLEGKSVAIAAYDQNGRMVELSIADDSKQAQLHLRTSLIKLFLVSNDFVPLSCSSSVSVD